MRPMFVAAFVLACGSVSNADVAFDNFGPGSTFTGSGWLVRGPLTPPWWTHAFPVTAAASGNISVVTVAMNHLSGSTNNYVFELRADASGTPGALIATMGSVAGFLQGPVPVQFNANPGISLSAGTTYWVYARGTGDDNGTWLTSPTNGGSRAYSFDGGVSFSVTALGSGSAQGAIRIEVGSTSPACYPNCDGSTAPPILNALDFSCFLNRFAAGEAYANCDGSTAPPELNALDFSCFLNKFAAGCS